MFKCSNKSLKHKSVSATNNIIWLPSSVTWLLQGFKGIPHLLSKASSVNVQARGTFTKLCG